MFSCSQDEFWCGKAFSHHQELKFAGKVQPRIAGEVKDKNGIF
jgi:hypothetical protein